MLGHEEECRVGPRTPSRYGQTGQAAEEKGWFGENDFSETLIRYERMIRYAICLFVVLACLY